jgi:coproporphyrinogen III oxidase
MQGLRREGYAGGCRRQAEKVAGNASGRGSLNFFACGLSLVCHPKVHGAYWFTRNRRYFEMYDDNL